MPADVGDGASYPTSVRLSSFESWIHFYFLLPFLGRLSVRIQSNRRNWSAGVAQCLPKCWLCARDRCAHRILYDQVGLSTSFLSQFFGLQLYLRDIRG